MKHQKLRDWHTRHTPTLENIPNIPINFLPDRPNHQENVEWLPHSTTKPKVTKYNKSPATPKRCYKRWYVMVIPRDVSVNRDYSNCHRLLFILCRVLYAILVAFLSSLSFFDSHLNLNVNLLQTQPTEGKEQNPKNRSNPIQSN